jgi:hypothetical protein
MPSPSFKPELILFGFCAIIVGFVLYIGYHSEMFPLWFILLLVAAASIVWWLVGKRDNKFSARFNELAKDLGLEVQQQTIDSIGLLTEPKAIGVLQGRQVMLDTMSTQAPFIGGILRHLLPPKGHIALNVALDAVNVSFEIQRRGPIEWLWNFISDPILDTGDPNFDRVWVIRTKQAAVLRAALTAELKAKLFAFAQAGACGRFGAIPTHVFMRYHEEGSLSDTARCERIKASLDLLTDLAVIAELNVEKKS